MRECAILRPDKPRSGRDAAPDFITAHSLTYRRVALLFCAAFSITESDLLTTASFNFEVKSDYSIRIETKDQDLAAPSAGAFVLRWTSAPNPLYTVLVFTNLADGFRVAASNLPATPDLNAFTNALVGNPREILADRHANLMQTQVGSDRAAPRILALPRSPDSLRIRVL